MSQHTGFKKSEPKENRQEIVDLDYEDIVNSTDIGSLVSEFVELRPQGSRLVGICPFHSDSSPSFTVSPAKGVYGCWSCDAGLNGKQSGNAVTFVRRYFSLGYRDALIYLADRAGIPVDDRLRNQSFTRQSVPRPQPSQHRPKTVYTKREDEPNIEADKPEVLETMAMASNAYAQALRGSQEAINYLTVKRGISPSVLAKFVVGYAPAKFDFLRSAFGQHYESGRRLFDAGLGRISSKQNRFDFFRDRLMFGLRNEKGEIVAFGGRNMGEDAFNGRKIPKYVNSPETSVFNKSSELFGLYENKEDIKNADLALVVEGYMDVIALASHGIPIAVACMGTALTAQHAEKLLATTRRVAFCFDADRAGQEAALRSMVVMVNQGVLEESLTFVQLPDGSDPDDYVRQHGAAAFEREVSKGLSLTQFWRMALQARFPNADEADSLWQFGTNLLRDLHHPTVKQSLTSVTAKLSNKPDPTKKEAESSQRQQANKGFAPTSPSEAIRQAAMVCFDEALLLRPHLDTILHAYPSVKEAATHWLSQFDAAIQAGKHMPPTVMMDSEREHYQRRLQAAPSVLQQFCQHAQQEQMVSQIDDEDLDSRERVQKIRKNLFSKSY